MVSRVVLGVLSFLGCFVFFSWYILGKNSFFFASLRSFGLPKDLPTRFFNQMYTTNAPGCCCR